MRLIATNLRKAYPNQVVLDGLDLSVAAGEVVAIRGQSGTGKSTMLNCLGLIDRPDAGEIRLDGELITGLPADRAAAVRARHLGYVFQAFHLLPEFTVRENLLMAARCSTLTSEHRQRADQLLERVGLGGKADRNVRVLSGGERQRVALCRALVTRPGLVLADEPTGNLDPDTAEPVLMELLTLARQDGASVILVTHDDTVARKADRALQLRHGRLHTAGESLKP